MRWRRSSKPANPRDGIGRQRGTALRWRETAPEKREQKKFSPDKSEDSPELNAGSSESEDLPDPTQGSYRRRGCRSIPWRVRMLAPSEFFVGSPAQVTETADSSTAVGLKPVLKAFDAGGSLAATLPG